MAHLLGSKFCIESLRNDVTDVQSAIVDIFSRCGPVRFPSWKYPDKVSADLDLTELLETYDFTENEEDCQIAHIVLLELVIDRLLLFLQALSKFLEEIYSLSKFKEKKSNEATSTSVGLIVKKYWNRTLQLCKMVQTLQNEAKNKSNRNVNDKQLSLDFPEGKENLLCKPPVPPPFQQSCISNKTLAKDECHRACQTYETVFKPCEACHFVQSCLRKTGNEIITVCYEQQLLTDLAKFKQQTVESEWMTAQDVARWTKEFEKDLQRIVRHLSELSTTCSTVKTSLSNEQKLNAKLKNDLSQYKSDLALEKETQTIMRTQFDAKIKSIENRAIERMKEMENRLDEAKKKSNDLQDNLKQLEIKFNHENNERQQLELQLNNMSKLIKSKEIYEKKSEELTKHVQELSAELDRRKTELERLTKDLTKEKATSTSIAKNVELLLKKQESLSNRMNELDMENELLRSRNAELEECFQSVERQKRQQEEDLKKTEDINRRINKEIESCEQTATSLRMEAEMLKKRLQDSEKNQQLLLEFPDLTGMPSSSLPKSNMKTNLNISVADPEHVVKDMENQIEANNLRIRALEEQNDKLQTLISKLLKSISRDISQDKTSAIHNDLNSFNTNQHSGNHDFWPGNTLPLAVPAQAWEKEQTSKYSFTNETQIFQNKGMQNKRPPEEKQKEKQKMNPWLRHQQDDEDDDDNSISEYSELQNNPTITKPAPEMSKSSGNINHSGIDFVVGHAPYEERFRSRPNSRIMKQTHTKNGRKPPSVVTVLPKTATRKNV